MTYWQISSVIPAYLGLPSALCTGTDADSIIYLADKQNGRLMQGLHHGTTDLWNETLELVAEDLTPFSWMLG